MHPNLKVKPGETKEQYRARITRELKAHMRRRKRAISRGDIPVVMDVDDLGFMLPGYDDLLTLKNAFPNFKITAFTIPLPAEFYHNPNAKHFKVDRYREWAKIMNENDWLEIAIHGFSHVHNEMETSYDKAIQIIDAFENLFQEIGLEYSKIFKAPYWQYSWDALLALRDRGYIVAIDRNHQRPVPDGLKTYIHNWSFEEPLPDVEVIKGHGHFVGNNTNNIGDTLGNIQHQLPRDTNFLTIGDYIKQYGK